MTKLTNDIINDIIKQNKRIPGPRCKAPQASLISMRAWKVKQNTTFPQLKSYNDVIGCVGLQMASRFIGEEPELLLFFPVNRSRGHIRSFYARDLEEMKYSNNQ